MKDYSKISAVKFRSISFEVCGSVYFEKKAQTLNQSEDHKEFLIEIFQFLDVIKINT